jgi:hypothetical protein
VDFLAAGAFAVVAFLAAGAFAVVVFLAAGAFVVDTFLAGAFADVTFSTAFLAAVLAADAFFAVRDGAVMRNASLHGATLPASQC